MQNGLRSIIERMGNTQEFPRLKIGIGRPPSGNAAAHVLQRFAQHEREMVEVAVREAVDILRLVMAEGLTKGMSRGGTPSSGKKQKEGSGREKSGKVSGEAGKGP